MEFPKCLPASVKLSRPDTRLTKHCSIVMSLSIPNYSNSNIKRRLSWYGMCEMWPRSVWWGLHTTSRRILNAVNYRLSHWGRVTHICFGNLTIIGSDNGLSPGRRQAINWTNVGILLIGPLWSNFSETFIEIHTFSFKKIHLKMSSGKWRPFCLGLNVLYRSFGSRACTSIAATVNAPNTD